MMWAHRDGLSLSEFLAASVARGVRGGPWANTPGERSALRGLCLQRAILCAQLVGSITVNEASETNPFTEVFVQPGSSGDGERGQAARTLLATASILSEGQGDASPIETISRGTDDVGAFPVAVGVGIVVVGLANVAVIGYLVHRTSEVIDRQLSRRAEIQKLAQKDAVAMDVLKRHTDRESAAGKTLPLDDASKQVLGILRDVQQTLAAKKEAPMSEPLGGAGGLFSGVNWIEVLLGVGLGVVAVKALK